MPYSIVHSEIAFLSRDFLKYLSEKDFLEFLVWNIFVDSSHLLFELWYKNIHRHTTHYYRKDFYEIDNFPEIFWEQEKEYSPLFVGYYFHLLTDKIWRDSNFIEAAYKNLDEEREYQISRKIHAFMDYKNLLWNKDSLNMVEKLYTFSFEWVKTPSIFTEVKTEDLERVLYGILDYMLGKKLFVKKTEKEEDYSSNNGEFIIKDSQLQEKVQKKYPYEEYNFLKKEALYQFQIQMSSKLS